MKLLSYLTLSALITITACSHHPKKDCCAGKDQMSCAKENCNKPCCDKDKKCSDGSCAKPKTTEAKACCGGESCQKKS